MQVQAVEKNKLNEAFKSATKPKGSSYSDLSAVIEAANAALHPNGLVFSQDLTSDEFGVSVRTNVLHESGEVLVGEWCKFPAAQKTPQGYGSTSTYVRRYSLKARMGMADEDDDGNAGSVGQGKPPPPEGMAALRAKLPPDSGPIRAAGGITNSDMDRAGPPPVSNGAVFPNYGRAKGQPVRGASRENLEYYLNGARKSLADPAKARFHETEAKLVAAIEAEIARGGA